jgi:hypothetical protein
MRKGKPCDPMRKGKLCDPWRQNPFTVIARVHLENENPVIHGDKTHLQ